jgi:hypothetical protein
MCGKEIEKDSPSSFLCIYCLIKDDEAKQRIENGLKKCYCGKNKRKTELLCTDCKEEEKL